MTEVDEFDRYRPPERRENNDRRDDRPPPYHDRRRDYGRGRPPFDDRQRGGRGGRHPRGNDPRRSDDRFRLLRMAGKEKDWKGDPVKYSKEEEEATSRRPMDREGEVIQNCLRLLWSSSPSPEVHKETTDKKRRPPDSDESSSSSDSVSSSSASSSSEESRRRRRRRRKEKYSSRRRRDDRRKKRSKRRRYSSSSSSSSSSSESSSSSSRSESDSDDSRRARKRSLSHEGVPARDVGDAEAAGVSVAAGTAAAPIEDSDDDSVGPRPAPAEGQTEAASFAATGKANYGQALLPGEGSAMAQFVQNNMRVPRRGEIGYGADEIDRFEKSGYVMSGSRHARMNAVRIRKENQVYSAEEQRALAMIQLEEKAEKEKAIVQDFQKMLEQKLQAKPSGS